MGSFDNLLGDKEAPAGSFAHLITGDASAAEESKSRVQQLRDRLIKAEESVRGSPGYGDVMRDSFTFGLGRPVSGLAAGVAGAVNPQGTTFGERYQAGVQAENARQDQADKNLGWGGTAARIVAGVPASAIAGPTKVVGNLANMGVSGAQGFVQGASENADQGVWGATVGGAKRAALNAGLTGLIGKALNYIPGARAAGRADAEAAKGIPADDLVAAAKPIYQQLDNGGMRFAPHQMQGLGQSIDDLEQRFIVSPNTTPGVLDQVKALKNTVTNGATYSELQDLTVALGKQARSADEATRAAASQLRKQVMDLFESQYPAVNPQGLDPGKMLTEANGLWRKAELVDDITFRRGAADLAQRGATTTEDITSQFKPALLEANDPKAFSSYNSPELREQLAKIINGGPAERALQTGANIAGSNTAKLAAGIGTSGLLAATDLAAPGAGTATKLAIGAATGGGAMEAVARYLRSKAAEHTSANVDELLRYASTGQKGPWQWGQSLPRDVLAEIMAAQDVKRAVGSAAANRVEGMMK